MTVIILIKALIVGLVWTLGWCVYYDKKHIPATLKTVCIAFAPWIALVLAFLLFVW